MKPRERASWWVWIVLLCPAAGAEPSRQWPNATGQQEQVGGTLQGYNRTREETGTDGNMTSPTNGTPTAPTTAIFSRVRNSTEHKASTPLKPKISIRSVDGACNVTLNCTVSSGGRGLTYAWSRPKTSGVLSTGPALRVTEKPQDGILNYTCVVTSSEGETSSMVSLTEHCHSSTSVSAKFWVPSVLIVIVLIILFLMYRRKRGIASRSRTASINVSSDSDSEISPFIHGAARGVPFCESLKPIEEDPQAEEMSVVEKNEQVSCTPDQPSTQNETSPAADNTSLPSQLHTSDLGELSLAIQDDLAK